MLLRPPLSAALKPIPLVVVYFLQQHFEHAYRWLVQIRDASFDGLLGELLVGSLWLPL